MTVQAGVEISLELLVGEFEEQACEHFQHGTSSGSHGGKATHYYQRNCKYCGHNGDILAVCWPFTTLILTDSPLQCAHCFEIGSASEIGKIISPIS